MKLFKTNDLIISLENVRRVEKALAQTRHTSYGKPYTTSYYSIEIIYCDGKSETISCGKDDAGKNLYDAFFDAIYTQMSEG